VQGTGGDEVLLGQSRWRCLEWMAGKFDGFLGLFVTPFHIHHACNQSV